MASIKNVRKLIYSNKHEDFEIQSIGSKTIINVMYRVKENESEILFGLWNENTTMCKFYSSLKEIGFTPNPSVVSVIERNAKMAH